MLRRGLAAQLLLLVVTIVFVVVAILAVRLVAVAAVLWLRRAAALATHRRRRRRHVALPPLLLLLLLPEPPLRRRGLGLLLPRRLARGLGGGLGRGRLGLAADVGLLRRLARRAPRLALRGARAQLRRLALAARLERVEQRLAAAQPLLDLDEPHGQPRAHLGQPDGGRLRGRVARAAVGARQRHAAGVAAVQARLGLRVAARAARAAAAQHELRNVLQPRQVGQRVRAAARDLLDAARDAHGHGADDVVPQLHALGGLVVVHQHHAPALAQPHRRGVDRGEHVLERGHRQLERVRERHARHARRLGRVGHVGEVVHHDQRRHVERVGQVHGLALRGAHLAAQRVAVQPERERGAARRAPHAQRHVGLGLRQHHEVRDAERAGDVDKVAQRVALGHAQPRRRVRHHHLAQVAQQLAEGRVHLAAAQHERARHLLQLARVLLVRAPLLAVAALVRHPRAVRECARACGVGRGASESGERAPELEKEGECCSRLTFAE